MSIMRRTVQAMIRAKCGVELIEKRSSQNFGYAGLAKNFRQTCQSKQSAMV